MLLTTARREQQCHMLMSVLFCIKIQQLINEKIQARRVKFKLKELPKSTANELVTSEKRLKEVECDHISLLQSDTLLCLEQH